MGLLYKHRDISFTRTRDVLGLTDGNLSSHADRLAAAGHLEARRVLTRDGFELRYRITAAGSEAFRAYLEALRRFLEAAEPGSGESAGL
jgi:DNA-binding MarR family transcriptional regulator